MSATHVPTKIDKPWGYELHWAKTDRYVGKILHITAGHALSLQFHNVKDETVMVHSGKLLYEIEVDGVLTQIEMGPGTAIHVTTSSVVSPGCTPRACTKSESRKVLMLSLRNWLTSASSG